MAPQFLYAALAAFATKAFGSAVVHAGDSIDGSGSLNSHSSRRFQTTVTDVMTPKDRKDLLYSYMARENTLGQELVGTADVDYKEKGSVSLDKCARMCLMEFGCEKFSWGSGTTAKCKISVGKHGTENDDIDDGLDAFNGQAKHGLEDHGEWDVELHAKTFVYSLLFYYAEPCASSCQEDYLDANTATGHQYLTPAQCAHACKNHQECKYFSAGPNTASCRIAHDPPAAEHTRFVQRDAHSCTYAAQVAGTRYRLHHDPHAHHV
jgi:hypothetical protein